MLARTRMIAVLTVLAGNAANAQQPAETAPAPQDRPVTVSLHVNGEFGFETSMKDSPGKVTVTRGGGEVGVGIPVAQYSQLNLGFEYEHSNYDFRNATGFVSGATSPFDDVNRETLTVRFAQHLSQQWSYFVGGNLTLSGEEGSKTGDSVEGLFLAAPQYSLSDKLSVGLGIAVATRLEDNVQVLPLVTIDWDFAEHWNLSNNGKPGLTVTYAPNEQWAFSLSGEYDFRDFRLDRNGPVPGGVGRETRIPIVLSAAWTPSQRISASAGVGVAFGQNYELLDSSGNSVVSIDADPAPFLTLRVGFRF